MTIDANIRSGLALNQNILLAELYGTAKHSQSYYELLRVNGVEPHELKLTKKQYTRARAGLINRGYITRNHKLTEKGEEALNNFNYITSGPMRSQTGIRNPPPRTLCSYLWAALRTKKTGTVDDLLFLVPDEKQHDKVTHDSARRILYWYCKLGLVRKLPRLQQGVKLTSPGFSRYQLIIDIGPKHPIIRQRKRQLYDPNSGSNVPFKEVLNVFKWYLIDR